MFIFVPTGLIRSLVRDAYSDYAGSTVQVNAAQYAEQQRQYRLARARGILQECTGPDACAVILLDNDWSECRIDKVPVQPPPPSATPRAEGGAYRAAANDLGPGPYGFAAVCPGRHVIGSTVRSRRFLEHFTLHPREVCLLRLDGEAGWRHLEPAQERAIMARADDLELLSYAKEVVIKRLGADGAKTSVEAIADCKPWLDRLLHDVLAGDTERAAERAQAATDAIIGAPLASFDPITTFIGWNTFDLVGRGKRNEAWALLQAGLSILPENPTLLGVLGELQLKAGAGEDGKRNLEKALAREAGLYPALRQRVRDLLASG